MERRPLLKSAGCLLIVGVAGCIDQMADASTPDQESTSTSSSTTDTPQNPDRVEQRADVRLRNKTSSKREVTMEVSDSGSKVLEESYTLSSTSQSGSVKNITKSELRDDTLYTFTFRTEDGLTATTEYGPDPPSQLRVKIFASEIQLDTVA